MEWRPLLSKVVLQGLTDEIYGMFGGARCRPFTAWVAVLLRSRETETGLLQSEAKRVICLLYCKTTPFVAAARSKNGMRANDVRNRAMRDRTKQDDAGEWKGRYGKTERREGRLRIAMRYAYGCDMMRRYVIIMYW